MGIAICNTVQSWWVQKGSCNRWIARCIPSNRTSAHMKDNGQQSQSSKHLQHAWLRKKFMKRQEVMHIKLFHHTFGPHHDLQGLLNVTRDPVLNTLHTCIYTPSVSSAEDSSFSPGRAQFHSSISCTTTPNLTWWLMTQDDSWQMIVILLDQRPQSLNIITCFICSYIKIFLPATSATLKRGEWKAAAMDDTNNQPLAVVDTPNRAWKAGQYHDLDLWQNVSPSKSARNRRGLKLHMQHLTWQEFLASIWG